MPVWVVLGPRSGQSANPDAVTGSEMDAGTSQGNRTLLQDFCEELLKVIFSMENALCKALVNLASATPEMDISTTGADEP